MSDQSKFFKFTSSRSGEIINFSNVENFWVYAELEEERIMLDIEFTSGDSDHFNITKKEYEILLTFLRV